ncbi:MAG: DUF664 domain-containing protein [Acidimicrobiales bacterium]|nr:DUF664 domain-containing protein [Acidimicrobiales bacterium]
MDVEKTPRSGPAKEMLLSFLQQNRAVVLWKTQGVSDELARQSPFASDTSIIGLLSHLEVVETGWFREVFAGHEIDYLAEFGYDFDADHDAEWHLDGTETLAEAKAMYAAAVQAANVVIEGAELDQMSVRERGDDRFSLRWCIVHMIEETARHAGHLDVLVEHLSQKTGYLPPLDA